VKKWKVWPIYDPQEVVNIAAYIEYSSGVVVVNIAAYIAYSNGVAIFTSCETHVCPSAPLHPHAQQNDVAGRFTLLFGLQTTFV
jgi:hypothetical protein